jgi:hypothetical protein
MRNTIFDNIQFVICVEIFVRHQILVSPLVGKIFFVRFDDHLYRNDILHPKFSRSVMIMILGRTLQIAPLYSPNLIIL